MNKRTKNMLIFAGGMSLGAIVGGITVAYRLILSKSFSPTTSKIKSNKRMMYKRECWFNFTSKEDAEKILSECNEIVDTYDVLTVADVLDLMGYPGTYEDTKFGWVNINTAYVKRSDYGYRLILPNPYPIR